MCSNSGNFGYDINQSSVVPNMTRSIGLYMSPAPMSRLSPVGSLPVGAIRENYDANLPETRVKPVMYMSMGKSWGQQGPFQT